MPSSNIDGVGLRLTVDQFNDLAAKYHAVFQCMVNSSQNLVIIGPCVFTNKVAKPSAVKKRISLFESLQQVLIKKEISQTYYQAWNQMPESPLQLENSVKQFLKSLKLKKTSTDFFVQVASSSSSLSFAEDKSEEVKRDGLY